MQSPRLLRCSLPLVAAQLVLGTAPAQKPDWPTWRGPTVDGHAAVGAKPPLEWSEDHNIRFKVELPGLGNSSPILIGDRIYLTTAIDVEAIEEGDTAGPQPGPPNADHLHQFLVMALERSTGKEVWRRVVREAKPHVKGHTTASHASASIVCSGDRLVAFFGSQGLYGLDLDGKVVWSKQFGAMKTLMDFGEGASPALQGDTLVLQWDQHGPSFVAAFDVKTGDERWRRPRKTDSSWGTPVITEVEGTWLVILTGSNTTCAYALKSGEPVWSCGGMSQNPVNSALVSDGVLYVMNSYKGRVVQAIPLSGAKGELDPKKDVRWTLRQDTSREGKTVVISAGDKFEVLATNSLDDVFDATPAFVGKQIFLRGRSHLYCIAEKD